MFFTLPKFENISLRCGLVTLRVNLPTNTFVGLGVGLRSLRRFGEEGEGEREPLTRENLLREPALLEELREELERERERDFEPDLERERDFDLEAECLDPSLGDGETALVSDLSDTIFLS